MKSIRFYLLFILLMIFGQSSFAQENTPLVLSASEKKWLIEHPVIRVGMDSDYAPYEWLDKKGHFVGMAVDYLLLLEKKLGVRFEIVKGKSWEQVVEMAKQSEIDVLTSIVETPQRLKYFSFSHPYRDTQTIIIDNGKGDFIGNLKHLEGKIVAIEKGYFTEELLKTNYPKIKLKMANNILEALQFVTDEKADAYVGDMSAIDYAIKKNGLEGLRFAGQTEFSSQHRFAFPKSKPELSSIMTKAMDSILEEETNAIFSRWIGMHIERGVQIKTIVKYGIAIFLLLCLFGYMYFRLQREIGYRKAAQMREQFCQSIDELRKKESHYRQLTENVMDVIWRTDERYCITYISPSDERLRGFTAEEVMGKPVYTMFTPASILRVKEVIKQRYEDEKKGIKTDFTRFEIEHICKDGRVIWGEVISRPERNEKGEIIGYHGITRDITTQKQMQNEVEQLAFYDALTKLPNRLLLAERLIQALAHSKRYNTYNALMFLDLDNFKALNDTYGHSVGDLLLCQVAHRLRRCIREVDTVARFGGDEFVVILSALNEDKNEAVHYAYDIAEKIRLTLSAVYMLGIHQQEEREIAHYCTASVGVLVFDASAGTEEDLLKRADMAMYKAKEAGKNAIYFYQHDFEKQP